MLNQIYGAKMSHLLKRMHSESTITYVSAQWEDFIEITLWKICALLLYHQLRPACSHGKLLKLDLGPSF